MTVAKYSLESDKNGVLNFLKRAVLLVTFLVFFCVFLVYYLKMSKETGL
jgi:preprotein translocase subunit SecG